MRTKTLALALLLAVSVFEWAKTDENGVIKWVIVASTAHIAGRNDGPWIQASTTTKVGAGHSYDASLKKFSVPRAVISISTGTP